MDILSGKSFLFLLNGNSSSGSTSGNTVDLKYINRFDVFSSLSVTNSWQTMPSFSLVTTGGVAYTYFISVNLGLRTFNSNTEVQFRIAVNGNPLNYTLRSTRRPNSGTAIFPVNLQAVEEDISGNSTISVQWNTNIATVEFRHGSIYLLGIPNSQII